VSADRGDDARERATRKLTVTVDEAAVMIGISRSSAYAAVARGEIPTVRIGRRLLVPLNRLLALLDGHGPPPDSPREAA
jgi:excisionase family DNA binding protein